MFLKALSPGRKSFYGDKTEWKLGVPMPVISGPGYSLGKSVQGALRDAKLPVELYEAEPCGDLLGEDVETARFTSVKIVREIEKPHWLIRVEKFIDSIKSVKWLDGHGRPKGTWKIFDTRGSALNAAVRAVGEGVWDATWAAAWRSVRAATLDTVRDAAWSVAWDSVWAVVEDAVWKAAVNATRARVWGADWEATRDVILGTAEDAAEDAFLVSQIEVASDFEIPEEYRRYARERWEVWKSGYGLVCEVNGAFYCYRKVV